MTGNRRVHASTRLFTAFVGSALFWAAGCGEPTPPPPPSTPTPGASQEPTEVKGIKGGGVAQSGKLKSGAAAP